MDFEELRDIFLDHKLTLGSVESFTGGLFASGVTSIPHASKYYKGGLVTYATEEKESLLGISHEDVEEFGVVSKEIAYQMAKYGQDLLNVDICVAFTGNAGPTAMEGKPVGEVFIAVAYKTSVEVFSYLLNGDREQIQDRGVKISLTLLKDILAENF